MREMIHEYGLITLVITYLLFIILLGSVWVYQSSIAKPRNWSKENDERILTIAGYATVVFVVMCLFARIV